MKIRKKFLQLTRMTYPYGTEQFLESFLPEGSQMDKFGNYYISIGSDYTTMFTCHLDTSCSKMEKVTHKFCGNYVMTDGTTILGADDKAGMVVVLYMIEKRIPGLYYFFIGEETGCIGSSDLADELEKNGDVPIELKNIKKVVSFDRRGTNSVITDQFYGVCCSDEFAKELCSQLNTSGLLQMRPDDTGILTDSAQFMGIIPECTNISVGYYDEHTHRERQDIEHLYKLCKSIEKVDWESLPVSRDPVKQYYKSGYYDGGWGWDGEDDWDGHFYPSKKDDAPIDNSFSRPISEYADYSSDLYAFVLKDGIRTKAHISQTWINHEKLLIMEMLKKQGRDVDELKWDGTSCWAREVGQTVTEYIGNRSDLVEFIEHIGTIPVTHLKYDLVFVS